MSTAIRVEDLVKVYKGGAKAVDGLSFQVGEGEIFGLLGPNGSGKTTTVRILVTLLRRTSGLVEVNGLDPERDGHQVRKSIGYAGQFIGVDNDLSARENMILQGRLHGLSAADAKDRTAELLQIMGLKRLARLRAGRYSGGMRRRVDLVQALVHRPPILFLDEPTTGMDPQSRLALWAHLRDLRREGTTILLTTQYLEEADRICDRIAIIDEGKLLRIGSPAALKDELGADRITFTLSSPLNEDVYERAAQIVVKIPEVTGVEEIEPLVVAVRDAGSTLPQILRTIEAEGIRIHTIRNSAVTLDDVFLRYTGHKVRPDVNLEKSMSALATALHGGKRPRR